MRRGRGTQEREGDAHRNRRACAILGQTGFPQSSGSNVIPRRARPGLAGLGPHSQELTRVSVNPTNAKGFRVAWVLERPETWQDSRRCLG